MSLYLQPKTYLAAVERVPKLPFQFLDWFPRVSYGTSLIEVPIIEWDARDVPLSSEDGESLPVSSGTIRWEGKDEAWIKLFHKFSHEDVTVFDNAYAALQLGDAAQVGADLRNWITKAAAIAQTGVTALEIAGETRRNIMCAGALQGTITGVIADGNTQTVSLNLQTITEPATKFDNPAAAIIATIRAGKRQFARQTPAKVQPTDAIIHEDLLAHIDANTEITDLRKVNSGLVTGYLGMTSGNQIVTDDNQILQPTWMGMRWHVVNDEYLTLAGVSAEAWDYKLITYLHRELADLQWAQKVGDQFTPVLGPSYQTDPPARADIKVWKTHRFDRGLPFPRAPQYVQRQRVIAA
jgi:hypothetical protein